MSEDSRKKRSADYSRDPRFEPESLFGVISAGDNAEQIHEAMREFLERGGDDAFSQAVAVYVRSARARGTPIEQVLSALNDITKQFLPKSHLSEVSPERLRVLVMQGLLIAFYGQDAISNYSAVRNRAREVRRKEDEQ